MVHNLIQQFENATVALHKQEQVYRERAGGEENFTEPWITKNLTRDERIILGRLRNQYYATKNILDDIVTQAQTLTDTLRALKKVLQ